MPSLPKSARRLDHISARGFTLMELMIVVILVGILSVMAIPAMGQANIDRRIYQETAQISDLIRAARARAIGRGSAVLVAMDGSALGKFNVRESVQANPDGSGNQVPRSACKSPTDWSVVATPTQYFDVAQVDLNGTFEASNNVQAIIYTDSGTASTAVTTGAFLCFTPLGRTYFVTAATAAAGMFDSATPMMGALSIEVAQRPSLGATSGLVRRVVIPPSGVTRLLTGPVLP